jgi:hypothetical protein
MEDSTSIMSLPNKAAGGGAGAASQPPMVSPGQEDVIDPQYMNQIINGIQQTGGATLGNLPSRNIPMHTMEIQQDPNIRANYIPPAPQQVAMRDYVTEYEERKRLQPRGGGGAPAPQPEKSIYDMLYLPILVGILYFLFQMPTVSAALFKYARFLHTEDGNITMGGIFLKTVAFVAGVYAINRALAEM